MYCPQCAAQLVDSDKFCRACGADLKAAALALAQQPLPSKSGKNKAGAPKKEKAELEKQGQGLRKAAEGATMLAGSLLIGLLIRLLFNHQDPLGIWVVFFGWMAAMGVFRLASGLGAIMQASSVGAVGSTDEEPQPVDNPVTVPDTDPLDNPGLQPLLSVTENTTRSLEPAHKEYVAKE
ncbi:MAG TPA: zinc ribbon domain-containing protein [Blastocatellia bacterium]|nr:zinc ribbon domain-containing protein [Blastocatellia bacterium]